MSSQNYFVGRVCTVFVTRTNRDFKDENPATFPEPLLHYFTGLVEAFDETGIVLRQLSTGFKTWFSPIHIIGVAEEQQLDEEDESDRAVIKQLKTSSIEVKTDVQPHSEPPKKDDRYVDIKSLERFLSNGSNAHRKT